MKMKKLLLLPALLLTLSVGNVACSYHNDDNPNEYPDPQPEPEPEPEPGPDINQKYLEAAYTSNCFMVKPGQSVDIPILKAFAMWNLYAEWLGETDLMGLTPEPVLLWQDLPGLITNVGLIPGQQAEEGSIAVSTADKVGNAVIGIRIGGAIRWSWHVWVTRYDPDAELVAYGKIYTWDNNGDGVVDYTFMDRNLGATTFAVPTVPITTISKANRSTTLRERCLPKEVPLEVRVSAPLRRIRISRGRGSPNPFLNR